MTNIFACWLLLLPDINECTMGTHICDANAACDNSAGSFACTCESGFTGDGFTCTGIVSLCLLIQNTLGLWLVTADWW